MTEKKHWGQVIIVLMAGIIGTLIGSSFQQYLSIQQERERVADDWLRNIYNEYLNMQSKNYVAGLMLRDSKNEKDEYKKNQLIQNAEKLKYEWREEGSRAVTKIAIFGHSELVEALAEYWRLTDPSTPCSKNWKTEIAIYREMRKRVLPHEPEISDSVFCEVVLDCTPN